MKVYVSQLPKSCEECPMCRSGKLKLQRKGRYVEAEQCVFGQYKYQTIDDEVDTCPLLSLADYTKQVRKEVVNDLAEEIEFIFGIHKEITITHIRDTLRSYYERIEKGK